MVCVTLRWRKADSKFQFRASHATVSTCVGGADVRRCGIEPSRFARSKLPETPSSAYRLMVSPSTYLVSQCTSPEPVALLAPNRMTARDQDSAVGEEVCSGSGKPTRERGRLFFVDFGSATA